MNLQMGGMHICLESAPWDDIRRLTLNRHLLLVALPQCLFSGTFFPSTVSRT